MITPEEVIDLLNRGKTLNEVKEIIKKEYYELRTSGKSSKQAVAVINNLARNLYFKGLEKKEIAILLGVALGGIDRRIKDGADEDLEEKLKEEYINEEIYKLSKRGLSLSEMEQILGVSVYTIKNRERIIYTKKGEEPPVRIKGIICEIDDR